MDPAKARWAYLLTSFVMNIMLGSAYSWSVFAVPLQKAPYGVSQLEATLPFALALATFAVGMVFAGRFVDRHGPRKMAMLGGALVSLGYILSYLMGVTGYPIPTLLLTYGVVMGVGIGFSYNPPIPTATRWFPDRKGLATGFVVMGYGLSPLFTAPLADFLILNYGIPNTFLILGVVFLCILVPLGSLLKFPPPDWKAPEPKKPAAARRAWVPLAEVETKPMLRTPLFWVAWLLYALGTAAGFMVIGNAKGIALEGLGFPPGDPRTVPTDLNLLAVAAVQMLAVFNSSGRPVFGRSADSFGVRRTLIVMYVGMVAAMAVLTLAATSEVVYFGIALTGLVFGAFLAVMPALATYFFGQKNLGSNYGFLFTGYGTGAIIATFAMGPIVATYQSYVPAFYIGIVLSLVGLVLSLFVRSSRRAAATAEAAVAKA